MKRADEARHREVIARARALLPSLDGERIHQVQALLEKLLSADRLDSRSLAELESLIDSP